MKVFTKYDLCDDEVQEFVQLFTEISEKCNSLPVDLEFLSKMGNALKGEEPISMGGLMVTKNSLIMEGGADISILLNMAIGNRFTATLN